MSNQKKIAFILAGCGHQDGSEITEAVATLIALAEFGAAITFFALDETAPTLDYASGKELPIGRNMLSESMRITRGKVQRLESLKAEDFDALVIPGGNGVLKNLSSFLTDGNELSVNACLKEILIAFKNQGKPIGAICIAPLLLARVFTGDRIEITLGEEEGNFSKLATKWGAEVIKCPSDDFITDRLNKILTSPAYMNQANPHHVFLGIRKLAKELVEMA